MVSLTPNVSVLPASHTCLKRVGSAPRFGQQKQLINHVVSCNNPPDSPELASQLAAFHALYPTLNVIQEPTEQDPRIRIGEVRFKVAPNGTLTLANTQQLAGLPEDVAAKTEATLQAVFTQFFNGLKEGFDPDILQHGGSAAASLLRYRVTPNEGCSLEPHFHDHAYSATLLLSDPSNTQGGEVIIMPREGSGDISQWIQYSLRQYEMGLWAEQDSLHMVNDVETAGADPIYRDILVLSFDPSEMFSYMDWAGWEKRLITTKTRV